MAGSDSSRSFQMSTSQPRARSTRTISGRARDGSNQWKACPTATVSTTPPDTGIISAVPPATATPGTARRNTCRMDAEGSTARQTAPPRCSRRVSFPVPAARSSTRVPELMPAVARRWATAVSG